MDLHYLTLSEVVRLARGGRISASEIVEHMLARIDALEPQTGAYVTLMAEEARHQAAALDARRTAGEPLGLLHAAPIALKDLLYTKGVTTTAGMALYRDWRPTYDATIVERLVAAGAIILGKLKLTEGASASHHPDVDPPLNPWAADRWTGASSSGPAVAVAGGLAHGAIASDTGGSIRYPAACCGLVGIKPTYGLVSRHGTFALAESMDHFGPMTRSVDDAARMLLAIAGHDPLDPSTSRSDVPDYLADPIEDLEGVRIGLDREYVTRAVEPTVAGGVSDVLDLMSAAGASIIDVTMPEMAELVGGWPDTASVECAMAHRDTYPSRRDEYGPALSQLIERAGDVTAVRYATLEARRREFRGELEGLFTDVDALLVPTQPMAPPTLAWLEEDPEARPEPSTRRFAAPFDYSGHPTVTLPIDLDADGIPRSCQLVGPLFGEKRLIDVARVVERLVGFHAHPAL